MVHLAPSSLGGDIEPNPGPEICGVCENYRVCLEPRSLRMQSAEKDAARPVGKCEGCKIWRRRGQGIVCQSCRCRIVDCPPKQNAPCKITYFLLNFYFLAFLLLSLSPFSFSQFYFSLPSYYLISVYTSD